MGFTKSIAIVVSLALPAAAVSMSPADAAPNKEALKAMLAKCSSEADAKGLNVKSGKAAARKDFRRECMRKMGVEPKK